MKDLEKEIFDKINSMILFLKENDKLNCEFILYFKVNLEKIKNLLNFETYNKIDNLILNHFLEWIDN